MSEIEAVEKAAAGGEPIQKKHAVAPRDPSPTVGFKPLSK
jgi:hypothetical protein